MKNLYNKMFSHHHHSKAMKSDKKDYFLNKLVDHLVSQGIVRTPKVNQVMRKVDRGDFCDSYGAYDDSPQPIGYNATISAPHMHAFCLEWLADILKPDNKVLDVGSGSGYLCAAFYEMMDQQGQVVGVEHIPELVADSINNLNKHYSEPMKAGKIVVMCGDGRLGCKEYAPYNAIHVGAGNYNCL